MEKSETVQHLVESAKLYQSITERLELIEPQSFESGLVEWILEVYYQEDPPLDAAFSMPQVMHYLQASHKLYISKTLPEIEQSMAHIQRRYDDALLNALVLFFNAYKVDFLEHIRMEERILFPYLKKLDQAAKGLMGQEEVKQLLEHSPLTNLDHDAIEDELQKVSEIIHLYGEEGDIPLPFKVFLNQVEIFEMDLRKHALIEDHVLLPMAVRMETELRETL